MVYILDEATAPWIAELRKTLQLLTTLRAGGKTIILITHRLSTLSIADRIVVLRDGSVAGRGVPTRNWLNVKARVYGMWKGGMDGGICINDGFQK